MTLSLSGLTVSLADREVVRGIDVTLAAGEVLGVIGPNGAGKSTLLRTAAGLLVPTAGNVTLDGQALAAWDRRLLARRIAFLPQERTVHWPLAVRAVVGLGRLPHASGPQANAEVIARAMEAADVTALAERSVAELSGGERARVLLARAFAQEAQVLLLDEPAAGLDPAHQLALYERLQMTAARGCSVMVALHDLSAAARYCHRLLLLSAGRQVALAGPREVLSAHRLAEVYGIRAFASEIEGLPIVIPIDRAT